MMQTPQINKQQAQGCFGFNRRAYFLINAITLYRLAASFILLLCLIKGQIIVFRWLLLLSFFTDSIDGWLARRYKVVSVGGARLDSMADDMTVLMGVAGMLVFNPEFIREHLSLVFMLMALYLCQLVLALTRYRRLTSFHTYLAKAAALAQAVFLVSFFFDVSWQLPLFYVAVVLTVLDLVEEIILVLCLTTWQADVKGLWWVLKRKILL